MQKNADRNTTVDAIKGIAILLVVMGHTMTGCTTASESSIFYNIVWSLQMPLFFLVSGYVTRYSSAISDAKALGNYITKRTIAYILPWSVWTFLVRGVLFSKYSYFNIKYISYHMDNGYWFLFSLWTICMIYGIACYISEKTSSPHFKFLLNIAVYLIGMFVLICIALVTDMSFLCIKLTLYYMPFFYAGVLFGKYQDVIFSLKNGYKAVEAFTALMAFVYIALLLRFNLFNISDDLIGIFIRFSASIAGCLFLCFAVSKIKPSGFAYSLLQYFGKHSLEIYLTHYAGLSIFKITPIPNFSTLQGFFLCVANYVLALIISFIIIRLLNTNRYLKFILFGRRSK